MIKHIVKLIFLGFIALLGISAGTLSDKQVKDFTLLNVDGKMVSTRDYPNAKGFIVVFTCNHCPFAKKYTSRLNDLAQKYAAVCVPLLAVNSTDTVQYEEEGLANMRTKATTEHWAFPYLYDVQQTVVRDFGAKKTPHAYVVWKENGNWIIKYNGAVDDNGAEPTKITHAYVAEAVDALLAGKEVPTKETKSIGCMINLRQ